MPVTEKAERQVIFFVQDGSHDTIVDMLSKSPVGVGDFLSPEGEMQGKHPGSEPVTQSYGEKGISFAYERRLG
jgi:hypothetical protein